MEATAEVVSSGAILRGVVCAIKVKEKLGIIEPSTALPDGSQTRVLYNFSAVKGKRLFVGANVEFVLETTNSTEILIAAKVWLKGQTDGNKTEKAKRPRKRKTREETSSISSENSEPKEQQLADDKSKGTIPKKCSKQNQQINLQIKEKTGNVPRENIRTRAKYRGSVRTIKCENENKYGFIRCFDKLPDDYADVKGIYFNFNKVQSGLLDLEENDVVEFVLGTMNKQKPAAIMVELIWAKRSPQKIEDFFMKVLHILQDESVKKVTNDDNLLKIISCNGLWNMIGDTLLTDKGVGLLLDLLAVLEKKTVGISQHYKNVLLTLCRSHFMDTNRGRLRLFITWKKHDDSAVGKIRTFILSMMKNVPERSRTVASIAKLLVNENKNSTEYFMFLLLREAVRASGEHTEDMEWNELPLIPSTAELLTGGLESWANLQPVKNEGPYGSSEEYLDTYFRLLRSDCFSALKNGVQALLKGNLDLRDMSVYHQVTLVGFQFARMEGGLLLALKVTPVRDIKDWATCSNLMFGNLLCLSLTGSFTDPIWATVVDRDVDWLKKSNVIFVGLSEENTAKSAQILVSLTQASGSIIMVESPTYYRAYQPVMTALQHMDPENIPFQDVLVNVQPAVPTPYIDDTTDLDPSIVYTHLGKSISAKTFIHSYSMQKNTTLDDSQETALKEAFKHQVAVIQGPPGTGKSFVGIKIVQLLMTMNTKPESPILVLTYKNHALDEFLKDVISHFPKGVVRVGGRSSDPELQKHNLNSMWKEMKRTSDAVRASIDLRDTIQRIQVKLEDTMKRVHAKMNMTIGAFVKYCTPEQLETFLVNCNWQTATGKSSRIIRSEDEVVEMKNMISKCLATLQEDVKSFIACQRGDDDWKFLWERLKDAYYMWLPPKNVVDAVYKDLQDKRPLININPHMQQAQLGENLKDIKDIEEEMKERLAAVTIKETQTKKEKLIQFTNYQSATTPKLACLPNTVLEKLPTLSLGSVGNLWELKPMERAQLLQLMITSDIQSATEDLEVVFDEYTKLLKTKSEMIQQQKVKLLSSKQIIGMTITGASIHHDLLKQVKPAIVLVEEAAEVLEAQLLASMGDWVQHLVMIGDHKQLRPSVESYKLAKDFHMDISLMERLINNGLPFATLQMQNRMRPEFAEMLKDIYPDLKSNLPRVSLNQKAKCIPHSMFWWDHSDIEKGGRSYSNVDEANRAVRLALFLIHQGYQPSQITILAGYQGQVAILRQKVREAEVKWNFLFTPEMLLPPEKKQAKETKETKEKKSKSEQEIQNDAVDEEKQEEKKIKVHTIDLYQGDENDIVIVSMVRSNENGQIGFMKTMNRRCVAQSRARCGLYFVGNKETISRSPNWKKIIQTLDKEGCCNKVFILTCPKHPISKIKATTGDDITFGTFCQEVCVEPIECGQNHRCFKPCQPPHQHQFCEQPVQFQFPCGHNGERKCYQKVDDLICKQEVAMTFGSCGHSGHRLCYQAEENVKCKEPCSRALSCNPNHICRLTCGEVCDPAACEDCEKEREIEAQKRREADKLRIDAAREIAKKELEDLENTPVDESTIRQDLLPEGDTASEYYRIEDLIMRYIQPGHDWIPSVKRIEKVTNLKLEKKWLEAKYLLKDPSRPSELKFHGTSSEAVDSICDNGFNLPKERANNMFGCGIYFATDSSKSAQGIYTKGSNMLLVCDVLLGKTKTVLQAENTMKYNKIRKLGYDSLFAKRNTKKSGGVLYDEFVIYKPAQAIPRYVVYYEDRKISETPVHDLEIRALQSQGDLTKYEIDPPGREVDLDDPLRILYIQAEYQIRHLTQKKQVDITIKSVDYYVNKPLVEKFNDKMKDMEKKYSNSKESKYILAFHGTKSENIDSIINNNLQMDKIGNNTGDQGWFGKGIYFSEFPDVSLDYGQKLLLCKVLPGKSFDMKGVDIGCDLKAGFDSHIVHQDQEGRGQELVIFDSDQILPCYVIHI